MGCCRCDRGRQGVHHVPSAVLAGFVGYVASYRFWRPWCLTWGATRDEAERALPGDDLLVDPDVVTTRAVTVDAPAASIWPWLVQMGPGRGGAYTYDWIENLFGLNMHSADRIMPEHQHLEVGAAMPLGAKGPVMRVASIEPEKSLVMRSDDGNWIWAFSLVPQGPASRLISRNRISTPGASGVSKAATKYLMEPGSLIMERKMLLGIKQRSERLATRET